ncbi:MAG: Na-translocating system protein MpsC family protein [Actinomycetota bacterium]|nr:Na-translocating system protein MpsC family protein [Actinomycetota bacterium]
MTGRDERGMDSAQIAAAISAQIAALYTHSYEMPVKHATSYVLEDLVVALLDIELSLIERRMIEFGNGEQVHELHHAVEQAEAANFKAVVERATGRRVVAFASHIHLDPPFATELFRLGPSTAHPAEPR